VEFILNKVERIELETGPLNLPWTRSKGSN